MLDAIAQQIWQKAAQAGEANEKKGFRKDTCGAWILKSAYGTQQYPWGWEIDHITPLSQGGFNHVSNLRPLQWRNNAARQADRLVCAVRSDGTRNIGL